MTTEKEEWEWERSFMYSSAGFPPDPQIYSSVSQGWLELRGLPVWMWSCKLAHLVRQAGELRGTPESVNNEGISFLETEACQQWWMLYWIGSGSSLSSGAGRPHRQMLRATEGCLGLYGHRGSGLADSLPEPQPSARAACFGDLQPHAEVCASRLPEQLMPLIPTRLWWFKFRLLCYVQLVL